MHLGRFHATIYDLAIHFKAAELPAKLEQCAAALDQYAQSKNSTHLDTFRSTYEATLKACEVDSGTLKQPYAVQVIADLKLDDAIAPQLTSELQQIVHVRAFDHAGIASDFRELAARLSKKIKLVSAIDAAFTGLQVEYERVDDAQGEVGILLPREIVGETLPALTAELGKLAKVFRAINELTNAKDYDPKIRTVSSSWWEIFLELEPTQILVWVVVIERIVGLFKSNLEIKNLQRQLAAKEMPKTITEAIEAEIDRRISNGLQQIASDIRAEHAAITDEGRLNEIEIQLRQGLHHLALRINQGSQVEINVGLPANPKPPAADGDTPDQQALAQFNAERKQYDQLHQLSVRSQAASADTLRVDVGDQGLLNYLSDDGVPNGEGKSVNSD